jgi:hypothetical protein
MRKPQWLPDRPGLASKSRSGTRGLIVLLGLVGGLMAAAVFPSAAGAHTGPANPVATSYLARITSAPAGIEARVLGGDLRMWLNVPASTTVVVLDYRGAPYLRFSAAGVDVNTNSAMYYLNQPIPVTPPTGLSPHARPHWAQVSTAHVYSWHDGRLHALASVALAPGQRFVGRWKIPLLVDGQPAAIAGGLFHADDPSIVWFWPIAVVLLCLWAVSRLGRREWDRLVARGLGLGALFGITVLAVGHELYGEPFVTTGQEIVLALVLAFVAVALIVLLFRGPSTFLLILIFLAALWAGIEFVSVLVHGYVLTVLPAFLSRVAVVACLACGVGLIIQLFAFRLADMPEEAGEDPGPIPESDREDADVRQSLV